MSIPKYNLIRSNRKTLSLQIAKDGTLTAKAPLHLPKSEIERFIAAKADWINAQLKAVRTRLNEKNSFSVDFGSTAMLCGKEYSISAREGNRCGFDGEVFFFPPQTSPESIRLSMIFLYKKLAHSVLNERTAYFSSVMKLCPTALRITSASTRWGSCSGKNSVNFSWKLVTAPMEAIDYVVVHELAHIAEHNHSERFWRIVAGVFPDYKARRKLLTATQEKLSKENWD